jgi:hypothetical protein
VRVAHEPCERMRHGVYGNQKGRGCRSDVVTERLGKAREERESCVREWVRENVAATVTELVIPLFGIARKR